MFNRMREHPLWPVRRAAWALLVVGGVPALTGGLAVAACLYDMSSGRGLGWGSGWGVLVAGLAAIFLLIPGLIHLVFAVFVWRARAGAVLGAAIYTWVLLGLLALSAARDVRWLVSGTPGVSGLGLRLVIEGAGMSAFVALLWCLWAAGRCLRTQTAQGFELILQSAQLPQTGYPLTTPPPARGR